MRFIEVEIDGKIYRLTAHGQTADLYEELYGDDSDILQDLMAYANGNKEMLQSINKEDMPKLQKLAEIDVNKVSAAEIDTLLKLSENLKLNIKGRKKIRQVITCLLMQTEYDKGNEITLPELLKNIPFALFENSDVIAKAIELISGNGAKKKAVGQVKR